MVRATLRWTGVPQLYSFQQHLSFNMPRLTTATGVLSLLGIGAIHLYLTMIAPGGPVTVPVYLIVYSGLVFAASVVTAAGMVISRSSVVVKSAWAFGTVIAVATLAMYLVSRSVGLPGAPVFMGWWDYPLGTLSMILSLAYVGLHGSAVTGINVVMNWRAWNE